jgi:hypothetical protein
MFDQQMVDFKIMITLSLDHSVFLKRPTFSAMFWTRLSYVTDVHAEGRQAGNHDKNTQIPIITLPS